MSVLCPKCHRPFSNEFEKKEVINEDYHEGEQFTGTRSKAKTLFPVDRPKEIVIFKYYYKCKHCGFEWTETKSVDFGQSIS
jgi:hypothetical protein